MKVEGSSASPGQRQRLRLGEVMRGEVEARRDCGRVLVPPILDLWKKNIGNKGVKLLVETIQTTPYATIDFSFNGIESLGAKYISKALENNSSVVSLILDNNIVQDEGLVVLCKALLGHKQLRVLRLSRNYIGSDGCVSLSDTICPAAGSTSGLDSLQHLDLQWNSIGNQGAICLAQVLQRNNTLTYLNISRNFIQDEGFMSMAAAIKINSTITSLILDFNEQSDDGEAFLAEGLCVNSSLMDIGCDIQLRGYVATVFMLQNKVCADACNIDILHALRMRKKHYALRYEFVLLRELSYAERLEHFQNAYILSPSKNDLGKLLHWFLDVTELVFYLILSYLSC